MNVTRKWYCTCRGKPIELNFDSPLDDEPGEPTCQRCGATPSSDPKRTIIFKDIENWTD